MLTHFLVGKNSPSKYLSVGRFAYKWRFLKIDQIRTKFVPCFTCGYACWFDSMAIYKNHSRKLEQHTHCHSIFRPFSLLTHHLTMSVSYSKTLNDDTPLWKRSKDENAPDSRPPPHPRGDRGILSRFLCKWKQVNSLLPWAKWVAKFPPPRYVPHTLYSPF